MRRLLRPGLVTAGPSNEASHVVVAVPERVQRDPLVIAAPQVMRLPEFRELAGLEGRTVAGCGAPEPKHP
jgi:hypothetical protein